MTFLASCLNRRIAALFLALCTLAGCAGGKGVLSAPAGAGALPIAVLPIDNLTGSGAAPAQQIRQALMARLKEAGYVLLDDDTLQRFLSRHRVRYVGGIDTETARAFQAETGVKAVLVTNLTLYLAGPPPKIELFCRLVSTGEIPEIRWMDGVGMAGDDAPGILQLGLIDKPKILEDHALSYLVNSLSRQLAAGGAGCGAGKADSTYEPKVEFNPLLLAKGTRYSIGVIPFANTSRRAHAGEIVALHFVRDLSCRDDFKVTEPGVVREKLLQSRIVMEQGLSLTDLFIVHKTMNTDLLLTGKVDKYDDPPLPKGVPSVHFSTLLMQGAKRRVIWASTSYNRGDEKVFFFDVGRISTAYALGAKMVHAVMADADRRTIAPPREYPGETDIFKWMLEPR